MKFSLLPSLILAVFFLNCSNEEKSALKRENDSLRQQMTANDKALHALKEVSLLMDSLNAAKQVLRIELVQGTTIEYYAERMSEVIQYIRKTEQKIDTLESLVDATTHQNSAYVMLIDALQAELSTVFHDMDRLQTQVKKMQQKNDKLVNMLKLQEGELEDNEVRLSSSREELVLFENRIHELMIKSKVSEADAYYARAEAVYEAAKRTKLAPRKKKETMKEALELYKKALFLGKEEAKVRIDELERRV